MKNPLGYLGFLGLLGIVAIIMHTWFNLFFFCFFIFFRYFWVIPDELFRENVKKSATPAFFTAMILYMITAALRAFNLAGSFYEACLVIAFAASFIVFFAMLTVYQVRESRGRRE